MMEWIRECHIPEAYPIKKSYAHNLAKEFMAQTEPENYIRDGRVVLLRISAFEDWWRLRGERKHER